MSESVLDSEHERWMLRALELAQRAGCAQEVPVGAVVVRGQEIIGEGWNQSIALDDPTAHAEIMALRDAGRATRNYRLPDTILYVTVEPCLMCLGASIHARVARICYGAPEPKAGALVSQPSDQRQHFNHFPEVIGGVLAEPCSELISTFFAARRNQQRRTKKLRGDSVL